jgi:hypothetical protein
MTAFVEDQGFTGLLGLREVDHSARSAHDARRADVLNERANDDR